MGLKIKTKPYGEMEIDEKQVIDFPEGILGFDFIRKFALLDSDDDRSPFKWLQAIDEPELAFVIIEPIAFMKEYTLAIPFVEIEAVGSESADELIVFAIVTIPAEPADMTANLQGPIIINPEKRLGRQAISQSDKYGVRHHILEEMKKNSAERE